MDYQFYIVIKLSLTLLLDANCDTKSPKLLFYAGCWPSNMVDEISMMFTMAFAMRTMWGGIGSGLYCQEIPIQIGLMG
jgi:hypothetical protein